MTWNHRIIKRVNKEETTYQIHEVYYDEHGKVEGWTADAMAPWGESLGELRNDITHFWSAFRLPMLEVYTDADEKEQVREVDEDLTISPGHFFEVMDRASVAMAHFDDFVGSHPVVRRDDKLSVMATEITDKMYELYNQLARLGIPDEKEGDR